MAFRDALKERSGLRSLSGHNFLAAFHETERTADTFKLW